MFLFFRFFCCCSGLWLIYSLVSRLWRMSFASVDLFRVGLYTFMLIVGHPVVRHLGAVQKQDCPLFRHVFFFFCWSTFHTIDSRPACGTAPGRRPTVLSLLRRFFSFFLLSLPHRLRPVSNTRDGFIRWRLKPSNPCDNAAERPQPFCLVASDEGNTLRGRRTLFVLL